MSKVSLPYHSMHPCCLLGIHIGAFEENLRAAHAVEQLLGFSTVGFELLACHLKRVDL